VPNRRGRINGERGRKGEVLLLSRSIDKRKEREDGGAGKGEVIRCEPWLLRI